MTYNSVASLFMPGIIAAGCISAVAGQMPSMQQNMSGDEAFSLEAVHTSSKATLYFIAPLAVGLGIAGCLIACALGPRLREEHYNEILLAEVIVEPQDIRAESMPTTVEEKDPIYRIGVQPGGDNIVLLARDMTHEDTIQREDNSIYQTRHIAKHLLSPDLQTKLVGSDAINTSIEHCTLAPDVELPMPPAWRLGDLFATRIAATNDELHQAVGL